MPVFKGDEGAQLLVFGSGDIGVSPGRFEDEAFPREVIFTHDGEQHQVGDEVTAGVGEKTGPDCVLRMQFLNVESLDVVLSVLQLVREQWPKEVTELEAADLLTTAAGLARTANDTSQPLSRREHARDSLRRWIDDHPRMFADAAERVRQLEADNERLRFVVNGLSSGMIEPQAAECERLRAENERLRADYPGGDQEAQALAWSAVYRKCRESGMPNFYKESGRESVLAYISELVALRTELDEAVRLLEPFTDIGIPDNWPSNCVLTWEDSASRANPDARYAVVSYLSSRVAAGTAPLVADYRSASAFVAKHKGNAS